MGQGVKRKQNTEQQESEKWSSCIKGLGLSKVPMKTNVEVPGKTVVELVTHWGTTGDIHRPAFVSVDSHSTRRSISCLEVLQLSRRFAFKLRQLGVVHGDIVCNALPNSLERVVSDFGILFAGGASMNGQIFRTDGQDFKESLRAAKCHYVIVDPGAANGARKILRNEVPENCENTVTSSSLPDLRKLIICERNDAEPSVDFLSSLKNESLPEFVADVAQDDLATVMTTSGSTGYSKLVKLTHSNICHFARQVKGIHLFSPGDRFINCAMLGWAGGYPQWYLACGVTRYFIDLHDGPPQNLPHLIWNTIIQEKIIYAFLSPMYIHSILSDSKLWKNSSSKPKTICLAGQPIKKSHLEIIGKLCDAVDINYGMTECNLVTTLRVTDASTYNDSCAGYPGYGVKLHVVDRNRKEVVRGETGEILMWSPALCSGYLNNESACLEAFTESGWFCTGDAGYIDEEGKLIVEGRQSDSIHRGAYILYPGWLEQKLKVVEGVDDIVIVPVPDPVLHNEICACVVSERVKGVVAGPLTNEIRKDAALKLRNGALDEIDSAQTSSRTVIQNSSRLERSGSGSTSSKKFSPSSPKLNGKNIAHSSKYIKDYDPSSPQTLTHIKKLESKLHQLGEHIELLDTTDAMRMVPKYYVFFEKFSVTSTGKVSRKEIQKQAASALGLL